MAETVQERLELSAEGPIFREDRFASKLSNAATDYLDEYVFSPEEFVADHEPTEFEHQMLADFIGGLFADQRFSSVLHSLIEKQRAAALIDSLIKERDEARAEALMECAGLAQNKGRELDGQYAGCEALVGDEIAKSISALLSGGAKS